MVALLGPRQCGKTTLARQFVPVDSVNYFDLEDPQSIARLTAPDTTLRPLRGLVVLDVIPWWNRASELVKKCQLLANSQIPWVFRS